MSRNNRKRELKSHATYHVVDKINRDEIIFSDAISVLLIETIARCKKKYSFKMITFVIMGNHTHFMIKAEKNSPLPKIMQWIKSVFAKKYNKITGQSGHVWKERYFSVIIETVEQLIATFTYIVRNPLEAGLIQEAKDYRYGGLYHYLHKIQGIITEEPLIGKLYEHCKDFHR